MINDGPYYRLCGNEAEIIKGMMQWLRWLYEYWSVFNTRKPCYRREDHTIAVNFDMYKILQWHRAVSLPLHDFFCIYQWQFKGRNYTQYADFHGRGTKPKITAHDQNQKVMVIMNTWLSFSAKKCCNSPKCSCLHPLGSVLSQCKISYLTPCFRKCKM